MDANRVGRRHARRFGLVLAVVAATAAWALPVRAADPGISIELNKAEDNGGSCVASFVLRNGLGQPLDRFNLDLYVFDNNGVIARQVLLDLAPLRNDKTTVFRFALIDRPCADIGHVLVNDIPACRAEGGQTMDCLKDLTIASRGRIALTK
jgi:hypothetical protein